MHEEQFKEFQRLIAAGDLDGIIEKLEAASNLRAQARVEAIAKMRKRNSVAEEVMGPQLHESCMRCDEPLTKVFGDQAEWETTQMDNALLVHLEGGYGMFVDWIFDDWKPKPQSHRTFLICHDCAAMLFRFLKADPTLENDNTFRSCHPCSTCEYGWTDWQPNMITQDDIEDHDWNAS